MAPEIVALEGQGLWVSDLVETPGQVINPQQGPGETLFVTRTAQVAGCMKFDRDRVRDPADHAALMDALKAALAAVWGPGAFEAGMGSPDAPESPLCGYFRWALI